jgi:predicted small lipoprotein YifL
VTRSIRPARARRAPWALLVLTAATLALGGCGRKGGLDLPPQAAAQPMGTAAPATDPAANSAAGKGASVFAPTTPTDEAQAARGRKRSFVLDPILD